jgi:nitrous oxidase accessory protein NosD
LSGSGSSTGVVDVALVPALTGVTIRNGTIADFRTGIILEETADTTISHVQLINDAAGLSDTRQGAIVTDVNSSGIHVDHCLISTSGRAIWTQNADITVDHTTVSGGAGILLADGGMTLAHDTLTDAPINTSEAGGVTITHSVLNSSPIDVGFEAFVFTTISHNLITGAAVGISIEFPSIDATISGNVFRNDRIGVESAAPLATISTTKITGNAFINDFAAGVLLDTTGPSRIPLVISGNRFVHDGFSSNGLTDSAGNPVMDGLHINSAPGSDIVISGNHTRHNAAYGIRAVPGTVVDGGGNTSVGNPDGCLGVTCS